MQEGGGDEEGLTTGAKADFCLTAADTMLAGEKEKTPEEDEQLEGSEVEEAIVGLDGTTGGSENSHVSVNSLTFFQTRFRVGSFATPSVTPPSTKGAEEIINGFFINIPSFACCLMEGLQLTSREEKRCGCQMKGHEGRT